MACNELDWMLDQFAVYCKLKRSRLEWVLERLPRDRKNQRVTMVKETITKEDVVSFVMDRLGVMGGSCNSFHINCVDQQIRGVIWLATGKDPGRIENTVEICKLLDIPYRVEGDMVHWGDQA